MGQKRTIMITIDYDTSMTSFEEIMSYIKEPLQVLDEQYCQAVEYSDSVYRPVQMIGQESKD